MSTTVPTISRFVLRFRRSRKIFRFALRVGPIKKKKKKLRAFSPRVADTFVRVGDKSASYRDRVMFVRRDIYDRIQREKEKERER